MSQKFIKSYEKTDLRVQNKENENLQKNQSKNEEEVDSFKSLLYKYRNIEDVSASDIVQNNLKIMEEGMSSESGPKYLLDKNQIQKIDFLADKKLDDLAESGISREELLEKAEKGYPLKADPFFQLIRNDKKVRFNYFDENEEYSVSKIVNLAVEQNIGYDTSASGTGRRMIEKQDESEFPLKEDLEKEHEIKEESIEDYYLGDSEPNINEYLDKDPIEIYKPIERVNKKQEEIYINPE